MMTEPQESLELAFLRERNAFIMEQVEKAQAQNAKLRRALNDAKRQLARFQHPTNGDA
jgi:F0F1-type ATP synthase membrane subunit b/b'